MSVAVKVSAVRLSWRQLSHVHHVITVYCLKPQKIKFLLLPGPQLVMAIKE